ncbi:MAG TPA: bifunctional phosphoribosyl-AMP cyclohydrolase/phosphoribosyl-ATP diphosphatase HisIE [Cyclobacteriaceae bacterium]|nr:bifunctional phosphoribosyl-AMP cyclohydrolase/phosphoribosyl-ATP diphosphatase HisIE [Cyclobacteriaceae bacterium]
MVDVQKIQFDKLNGIVPAVVQDSYTRTVLMVGFMNPEALQRTIDEKRVTFYSRSKKRLWTKGETSGNFLALDDIKLDCDNDTLLVMVRPGGPTCHTGADTCFNTSNLATGPAFLERIISDRKKNPKQGSYTNTLLSSGINKIAQKVGEEAVELVIEAKDNNRDLFVGEAADLMYHFMVLLAAKEVSMEDVTKVLHQRHQPKPS